MSTRQTARREASPFRERVAAEIRAEMARQQISGSRLARMVGMSQASMSVRLQGRHPFDVDELERVARALDVSVGALIGLTPRVPGPGPNVNFGCSQRPGGLLAFRRPEHAAVVPAPPVTRSAA